MLGILAWLKIGKGSAPEAVEAEIQREIAQGLFGRALPYLLEQERFEEAAEIELRRGDTARAAKLFERAGNVKRAAEAFASGGDLDLAALTYKKADMYVEAAEVYVRMEAPAKAAEMFAEAGRAAEAARWFAKAGLPARGAEVLESVGDEAGALKLRAQDAEGRSAWGEAAALWEEVGDKDRAIELWQRAGKPKEVARLRAETGDLKDATRLMVESGDFKAAADLYARLGKYKQAAEAAFRGGDLPKAVGYLNVIGDVVTTAKVLLSFGKRQEAKRGLSETKPGSEQYVEAMEMLATLERQDGDVKAAYKCFEQLVRHAIARNKVNAKTREHLVQMTEMLLEHGKKDEAIVCLEKIVQLDIATPDLRSKLRALKTPSRKGTVPADMKAMSTTLSLPQHPRYDFVAKIGQGGNGAIYRAKDKVLSRPLVIKMIVESSLPGDLAKKWFFREAQVAAGLNHPHIVTVYDLDELDGQPYIAMELVEGQDLSDFVEGRLPMTPKQVMPIVRQLASALQYAHDKGVIHRDIKLANVMITEAGNVKLMDFGLAKAIQGPSQTVVIAGTPAYMSPEQILGRDVDHRTDIYALGVMLFKMLTDRFPYEDGNILQAHRKSPVPDPREFNPKLPHGIDQVFYRALAKDKSQRYQRVQDLAEALEVFVE